MPIPPVAASPAAYPLLPVFNVLSGAFLLLNPDFVIVGASDDYLAATLAQRDVIVGQHIFDAFPDNPDTPEANGTANVRASLEQVLATQAPHDMAPQHYDVPDPAHPGRFVERHWQPRHTPVLDAAGQVQFIIQSVQDITARRQVEQLNQELETRVADRTRDLDGARAEAETERHTLRALIAEAPAVIARMRGPHHVMELATEQFRRLLGGRELAGRPYREALPDLENQPFFDQIDAVYRTGQSFYGKEVPVQLDRTNSGQLTLDYFNYVYQATRDAAGQVDGILMFAEEVTEQVLARQEREAQRRQLHNLFMQAPAPVVILDGPALVYELVNPAYQRIFPGRALLGKPLLEALPELAGIPLLRDLQRVYDTGETYVATELPLRLARHEGAPLEEIYWTFTYQARRSPHGAVDGILVFAHEVTDQVRARRVVEESERMAQAQAAELAAANAQLLRTNEDLDNFVYTASHDLKAPISNLEALLTSLRQELPAPAPGSEVAFLLNLMQDSVTRFSHTLDLLTDVTMLQHAFNEGPAAVALAPLIEDVRLDLAPLLAQVGGRLHLDVAATPTIRFSEKNLRSIVHNLLSNAFKYHDPARPADVTVHSRAEGPYLVLEVQDNGLGLDLECEHQLFGLFRRYHTHVEGSGVGLHMVKKMVENGGGKIEVASNIGQGSTFTVCLPC